MNSYKSRLVKLFPFFFATPPDYLSVNFIFVAQVARDPATDFSDFGEAAVKIPDGWFSL